jgi:hypothetical protein
MKTIVSAFFILLALSSSASKPDALYSTEQTPTVFEGYDYANFKLKYLVTEGYSLSDRYSYEIIIIDSLMILNFRCPKNDDWDFIQFQKQMILEDEQLERIKWVVKKQGCQKN